MGPLSRWFPRRKKNKEPEQPLGAFSSTPTLDLAARGIPPIYPQADPRSTAYRPERSEQGVLDARRPVLRVERTEKDAGSDRWEQQLLAWRLSAYEDARRWNMIDVETHKILRHHAFLTPPPASITRPTQSAPARSQTFPSSCTRPSPSSPTKTLTSAIPPSSWNRPAIKPTQYGSSDAVSPSPTLGSFLSIPGSPSRPRSRLRTSRSVTSTTSTLGEDHPFPQPKPRKKEGFRNSFVARLEPSPSSPVYRMEDDLELLSRIKREVLTDDSLTELLRAEWARSRAEMRVVCGSRGLEGVVERIARESAKWRKKCGLEQDWTDEDLKGELDRLRGIIGNLATGKGEGDALPTMPRAKRDSVGSTEMHQLSMLDHPVVTAIASFPGRPKKKASFADNNHLQPSAQPHVRRTPSQLSGKSGSSFFSDLSRKSTGLGGRFGLNKGIQVSSPIPPTPSIVNHRVDAQEWSTHSQDTLPQGQSSGNPSIDEFLRLSVLRQLEVSLAKLIEEKQRLERVTAGYEERIELLQVKVRAAELRDQLVGR